MYKNIEGAQPSNLGHIEGDDNLYIGVSAPGFISCNVCDLCDLCELDLDDQGDLCFQLQCSDAEDFDIVYKKLKRRVVDEEQEVSSLRRPRPRQDR